MAYTMGMNLLWGSVATGVGTLRTHLSGGGGWALSLYSHYTVPFLMPGHLRKSASASQPHHLSVCSLWLLNPFAVDLPVSLKQAGSYFSEPIWQYLLIGMFRLFVFNVIIEVLLCHCYLLVSSPLPFGITWNTCSIPLYLLGLHFILSGITGDRPGDYSGQCTQRPYKPSILDWIALSSKLF